MARSPRGGGEVGGEGWGWGGGGVRGAPTRGLPPPPPGAPFRNVARCPGARDASGRPRNRQSPRSLSRSHRLFEERVARFFLAEGRPSPASRDVKITARSVRNADRARPRQRAARRRGRAQPPGGRPETRRASRVPWSSPSDTLSGAAGAATGREASGRVRLRGGSESDKRRAVGVAVRCATPGKLLQKRPRYSLWSPTARSCPRSPTPPGARA